jgi:hypothetical protein
MYVDVNVGKPTGLAPGAGIKTKSVVTLIDTDYIATMPSRDGKGVVINDPIILKDGKYATTLYITQDTVEVTSKSDGDTDNEGFTPEIKFKHPGNEQEIREFKANWLGRHAIIIVDKCNNGKKDLLGEGPCNPMKMVISMTATKDATSNEFTFTQMMRGADIAIYNNTVTYAEPLDVLAAGATEIALIGEGQYQLTGDTTSAAIATVTGAQHDLLFTLLGANTGTAPAIADGGSFILKDGAAWTGGEGKQITFKCFKSGATAYKFIEVSRV